MNFSSPDTARRCRLDSFLSVHASTVVSPTAFFRHLFYRGLIGSISRHAFYRCLANSILSTPVQPLSYWPYFSTRVQSLSRQRFSLSTRHALPSQLLSGCLCLINSCRPSVAGYPLSDLCCPSPVVSALLPFTRCRAVGWKGLFALCFAFSTDEWTRSGNESVELEMDLVGSRFVESRWK